MPSAAENAKIEDCGIFVQVSAESLLYAERRKFTLCRAQPKMPNAELAQLVEHWLPKPRVAGSSPVFRSTF